MDLFPSKQRWKAEFPSPIGIGYTWQFRSSCSQFLACLTSDVERWSSPQLSFIGVTMLQFLISSQQLGEQTGRKDHVNFGLL